MLYIAVKGQSPEPKGGLATVLLSMDEASNLFHELEKIFAKSLSVKEEPTLAPFPKIDIPIKPDPSPEVEQNKGINDLIEVFRHRKTQPYEWYPLLDPAHPRFPNTFPNTWKVGDVIDPKWTAASQVDWNQVSKNNFVFPSAPPLHNKGE